MTGLIEAKLRRAIAERLAAKVATFAKPSAVTADGSSYGTTRWGRAGQRPRAPQTVPHAVFVAVELRPAVACTSVRSP